MQFLQSILMVVGTTALGTVLGVLGVAETISLLQAPRGEPWTRGFGQYIGGLVCGAPMGALGGFVAGLSAISLSRDRGPWRPPVWLGVLLGLAGGAAFAWYQGMASGNQWWVAVTVVSIAGGTAGGYLTSMTLAGYEATTGRGRGKQSPHDESEE